MCYKILQIQAGGKKWKWRIWKFTDYRKQRYKNQNVLFVNYSPVHRNSILKIADHIEICKNIVLENHSRQLSLQYGPFYMTNQFSPAPFPLNVVFKLHFDSEGRTVFVF